MVRVWPLRVTNGTGAAGGLLGVGFGVGVGCAVVDVGCGFTAVGGFRLTVPRGFFCAKEEEVARSSVKAKGAIAVFMMLLKVDSCMREPIIKELMLEHKYTNSAAFDKAALSELS